MQVKDIKNLPNELTVTVEKLSNLGYGIAKYDGFVIFVENAVPKDEIKIELTKKNKNFAYAKIKEILSPSPHRIEPLCPMQKICGACQIQFIDYDYQLKLKKEIVEDTMKNIYGYPILVKDVIPSPKTKEYRHKIQYPISETKQSKRIIAGYYKPASHELVNIKYCPIQPEYCDRIIDFIRENAKLEGISGYIEKKHKGDLRHVVIRTSEYSKKSLVVLVVNNTTYKNSYKSLAKKIYNELDNIQGVCLNYNNKKTNLILGDKTELIIGDDFVEEKLCDRVFKIGAKTFFQVNPASAGNIFNYVKDYIKNHFDSPTILDAYAGIATFGICLSDVAKKITSVEQVKESIDNAKRIIEENGIKNIDLYCEDASKFFEKELKNNSPKYDIAVIDPPRKGCTKESIDYLLKLTKKMIIYVSCNPATLARDLKIFKENGCKIDFIQPFDMFPHTYHIENVALVELPNSL